MDYANKVWSNGNYLNNNLNDMINYRESLRDRKQRLEKNIVSVNSGLNYDLKTIVAPRSHAVAYQPSIGLVRSSQSVFH